MRAYLFLGPIQAAAAWLAFYFMYWTLRLAARDGHVSTFGAMAVGGSTVYVLATTMTHAAVVTTQIGNGFAQRTNGSRSSRSGFFTQHVPALGHPDRGHR